MNSNSAPGMQNALGSDVGGVRFVFAVEVSEGMPFPIDHDVCAEPSSSYRHANKTGSVSGLCRSPVLSIDCLRNVSEICEGVVPHVSVDVVNCVLGPIACNVKPRKPICEIDTSMNLDDASVFVCAAGDVTNGDSSALDKPSEDAGFWIVVKKLAQMLRCKIGLSHKAVLSLIGQRRAGVDSARPVLAL